MAKRGVMFYESLGTQTYPPYKVKFESFIGRDPVQCCELHGWSCSLERGGNIEHSMLLKRCQAVISESVV